MEWIIPLALLIQLFFIGCQDEKEQIIANKKLLFAFILFWPLYLLEGRMAWLKAGQELGSFGSFLWKGLSSRLLATAAILAVFFLISWLSRQAFGMGDAKLTALLVLYLGLWTGLVTLFLGLFFSFLRGLISRKKSVPLAMQTFAASAFLLLLNIFLSVII